MKKVCGAGVLGISLLLAGGAQAQEGRGIEVGVRSGYALPLGTIAEDNKLSALAAGVVPLWFDLGYRLTPNVMLGAYFQYGFGIVSSDRGPSCDVLDCSFNNMRLGLQAHYHFMPWEQLDPWVGLGVGYEWLSVSQNGSVTASSQPFSVDMDATGHGFEFVNVQGGLDITPSEGTNFAFGPFIALSVAQYSQATVKLEGRTRSDEIDEKAIHGWLTLGVRGTFVP